MKIFRNILIGVSFLLIIGCNKTVKPPLEQITETNQTTIETAIETNSSEVIPTPTPIVMEAEPVIIIEEEPELVFEPEPELEPIEVELEPIVNEEINEDDIYTSYYNDESINDGIASKIVVLKSRKIMVLLDENENILSRHRISLGKNDVGTKLKRGDYKTPEGVYNVVNKRSDKKYYKQISISYPNEEDKRRSKELGFNPGGGITIHAQVPWNWNGEKNDYTLARNWTQGCIAMTNEGIDMIWNNISPNTIVDIRE